MMRMLEHVVPHACLPLSLSLSLRGRDDKTGYEPRGLFNVVEFVMNDKKGAGYISLEEAMEIMYLRYGRQLLDSQLEEVFGTSDLNR